MNVCTIELGYVGFPLAELCVSKGHSVFGIDLSKKKIELIEKDIILDGIKYNLQKLVKEKKN